MVRNTLMSQGVLIDGYGNQIIWVKICKNHIETFFSALRARNGFNNNPTCAQFRAGYKKLLLRNTLSASISGNATELDNLKIVSL